MAEIINLVKPRKPLLKRLRGLSGLVFDWDGVFNGGYKGDGIHSGYFEPDILGINIFRFAYWLETKLVLPVMIITGANNPSAEQLCKREHYNILSLGVIDKGEMLNKNCNTLGITPIDCGVFFDDLNDLSMVMLCGVRCMISRLASANSQEIIKDSFNIDYQSEVQSGNYAIREIIEMMLYDLGSLNDVISHRAKCSEDYLSFLSEREKVVFKTQRQ
jgi:3-deoxy-D-manno-octulosonate 8-phosphate phosphatase (KDO 8-P phosphatase)